MASNIPINHHFVPECYLKGFSLERKQLYAYDKVKSLNKQYPTSSRNVCYIKNYYRIKESIVDLGRSPQFDPLFYEVEFFSKNIEAKYCATLGKIRSRAEEWLTNKSSCQVFDNLRDKELFAAYIAIQRYRLPWVRKDSVGFLHQFQRKAFDIYKSAFSKETEEGKLVNNLKYTSNKDLDSHYHTFVYANESLINQTQDRLLKKKWVFFVWENNTLYTSDNPIVSLQLLKNQPQLMAGLGTNGAQIIFPLSGRVLLVMYDGEQFPKKENYRVDCFNVANPRIIFTNQFYQYGYAKRHVLCSAKDFSYIENIRKRKGCELMLNDEFNFAVLADPQKIQRIARPVCIFPLAWCIVAKCKRWHAQILFFVLLVHSTYKFLPKCIEKFSPVHLSRSQF
ncbi:MAG: DUF4238 domain-containing protein [Parapedobacter sp.]|nr:MAG: DUF4238 domain-containing protein [Parapedobacter sp.]